MTRLLLVLVGLFLPVSVFAQCTSEWDTQLNNSNWVAMSKHDYTICYGSQYGIDADLVEEWVDQSLSIGLEKYGIPSMTKSGRPLKVTIFLPWSYTSYTRPGMVTNLCCQSRYTDRAEYHAEIHYFTPSLWTPPLGGLRYPTGRDYHAHYVVHEMLNLLHYSLEDGSYRMPSWLREGLAEYDGYFYTTEWNRTVAIDRLVDRVHSQHREEIFCCQTLRAERQTISTTSRYYGSAVIVMFLAEKFGEEIHGRFFEDELGELIHRRGLEVDVVFQEFVAWFEGLRE